MPVPRSLPEIRKAMEKLAPHPDGFNVAQYPGYRERGHTSYTRMFEYFERGQIDKLNAIADRRKKEVDQKEINDRKSKGLKPKKNGPSRGWRRS